MTLLTSLLKELEATFGLGHGRHVARCVAAFVEERRAPPRPPGMPTWANLLGPVLAPVAPLHPPA
eukprot:9768240-Lingulodinium_polyedra.AAC.1